MALVPALMQRHIDLMEGGGGGTSFVFAPDPRRPVVALDVETPAIGGPKWSWDCNITAWSIATDDAQFHRHLIDMAGPDFIAATDTAVVYRYDPRQLSALQWICDTATVVAHNSSFDLARLAVMGITPPIPGHYQDTMIAAYALGYPEISLSALAPFVGLTKVQITDKADYDNVTDDVLARCLSDTEITLRLYQKFQGELAEDPAVSAHYNYVDLPFSRIIREMEDTGLFVDRDKLKTITDATRIDNIQQFSSLLNLVPNGPPKVETPSRIPLESTPLSSSLPGVEPYAADTQYRFQRPRFEASGLLKLNKDGCPSTSSACTKFVVTIPVSFNPNSDAQIRWYLGQCGWTPSEDHPLTEGGLPQMSDERLAILQGSDVSAIVDFITLLRKYRRSTKLLGTYLENYATILETSDRIRCNFNQCLTRTGRLSSSRPNLQNIPSRGPVGKAIRSLFIPPKGMSLLIGDDSQIEARILADLLSRHFDDNRLVDSFKAGGDIHLDNALAWGLLELVLSEGECSDALIARLNEGEIDKDHPTIKAARELEKRGLYGVIYGAGAFKLGQGDMTLGQRIVDAMASGAPAIGKFKKSVVAAARRRPNNAVYNLFGRRALYPSIRKGSDRQLMSRAERQVVNYVIQSTSFSRCATGILQAYDTIHKSGALVAAMVHDEFMIYVPPKAANKVLDFASQTLSADGSLQGCPVVFEFKKAACWGEK